MMHDLTFTLNRTRIVTVVEGHHRLLDVLRRQMNLTGTKEGCGEGECGACTVLVDGRAVNACLFPALEAEGRDVVTVEGLLGDDNRLSRLQQSFVDNGAIQCGFCTPGMLLAARALLDRSPQPTDDEIREALTGNLCRCTGYHQIVEAIRKAGAS